MLAVISDISGKEISKHIEAKDAQIFIGGVIIHASIEEQIELMGFIAKLQEERMPSEYGGDFEPLARAQEVLDAYEKQQQAKRDAELKEI